MRAEVVFWGGQKTASTRSCRRVAHDCVLHELSYLWQPFYNTQYNFGPVWVQFANYLKKSIWQYFFLLPGKQQLLLYTCEMGARCRHHSLQRALCLVKSEKLESTQEVKRSTRLQLVLLPSLLSCSRHFSSCSISEWSTAKPLLFVKYALRYKIETVKHHD